MKEKDEYLSLYEFLGKAAGPKLGAEVKKRADENGVAFKMKDVPHSGFNGRVITYPKTFLEHAFRPPHQEELDEKDNDLPF
jgi:hypothetical protein